MFKSIVNKIKEAAARAGASVVPPEEKFDDPLVSRTQWTPLKGGGSNFCTHKLKQVQLDRVSFRIAGGAIIFCLIFAAFGMGALVFWFVNLISLLTSGEGEWMLVWFLLIFVAAFGGVGFGMLYFMGKPRVFCKQAGLYWKGRTDPSMMLPSDMDLVEDNFVKLDDICAIQLISEYCRSDKSSYYSYELNLVLFDGSRVNVVDHGSKKKILADAQLLANFLDVPLWDYT